MSSPEIYRQPEASQPPKDALPDRTQSLSTLLNQEPKQLALEIINRMTSTLHDQQQKARILPKLEAQIHDLQVRFRADQLQKERQYQDALTKITQQTAAELGKLAES